LVCFQILIINNLQFFLKKKFQFILGNRNGVTTQFKASNPFLTSVHCIAHRLHLAGKDAANQVKYFKDFESTCKELYAYFSGSYKRMINLKMIQETNDDPQLAVLNIINTRWLSLSNVVQNLYQIIDSIIDALELDKVNTNDRREKERITKLLDALDPKFRLTTMYMADLTFILSNLCKTFQKDNVTLSDLKYSLDTSISAIKAQFIGFDGESPTYGIILKEYLDDNPYYSQYLPNEFINFAKALIQNLETRFPNSELYQSMRIFDPRELPQKESELSSYGDEEIDILSKYFGLEKQRSDGTVVKPFVDILESKKEWGMVKQVMKSIRDCDIIDGWQRIWNNRPQFCEQFPNINTLINITLLVPLSNANVERVFSQHKMTKTRLRNRMNIDTINMHLMILLNAPDDLADFNWNKAFEYWEKKQARRISSEI
jgi:hypothetical protein